MDKQRLQANLTENNDEGEKFPHFTNKIYLHIDQMLIRSETEILSKTI